MLAQGQALNPSELKIRDAGVQEKSSANCKMWPTRSMPRLPKFLLCQPRFGFGSGASGKATNARCASTAIRAKRWWSSGRQLFARLCRGRDGQEDRAAPRARRNSTRLADCGPVFQDIPEVDGFAWKFASGSEGDGERPGTPENLVVILDRDAAVGSFGEDRQGLKRRC